MQNVIYIFSISFCIAMFGVFADDAHTESVQDDERYVLDEIRALVITKEGTELVTQSDLEWPNFFGKIPTLQEEVEERLLYRDAHKYPFVMTESQIDQQIANVMRQSNLTLDELKTVCADYGMTYQGLRDKLVRLYRVNSVREHVIESHLIINRSDIVSYYQEHPEMTEVVYHLQRAVVAYADDRDAQRAVLLQRIASKENINDLAWGVVFSIEYSSVADTKTFIHAMNIGDVVLAQELYNGFELYRLVDKQEANVRSLDERYLEIDELLRRPLREQLFDEYLQKLFAEATIIYF